MSVYRFPAEASAHQELSSGWCALSRNISMLDRTGQQCCRHLARDRGGNGQIFSGGTCWEYGEHGGCEFRFQFCNTSADFNLREPIRAVGCNPNLPRKGWLQALEEELPTSYYLGIVLNYCQYGVLYLGSYYNTGPYIHFPHFGNSNLGKLPFVCWASTVIVAVPFERHGLEMGYSQN